MSDLVRDRLTAKQRRALGLMQKCAPVAAVVSAVTDVFDGQPWVHWRTAVALWRKGLVELADGLMLDPEEWPEDPELRLTTKGATARV